VKSLSVGVAIGVLLVLAAASLSAQTSTWSAGAGNWAPCPQDGGNALWDTCSINIYPGKNNNGYNAVVQGGPVTLGPGNGITISNLTVASGDSVVITPGYLDITGSSIQNNGTIMNGPGDGLAINAGGSVTLSGSGTVNMTDGGCRIGSGVAGSTLVNQQLIQGQGALGFGTMAITNQGTISASGGMLTVQPDGSGIINTGTMEAQSGAQLSLAEGFAVPFNNTGGTIKALDGSTVLLQMNPSGGTLTTVGSGVFTLAPPGTGAGLTNLTNAATFNVPAGATLNWTGTINNTGVFNLAGGISTNGTVTLQGTGTVLMKNGVFDGLSTNPLINQQLIHGGGKFYQVPLTNKATIQADNPSETLFLDGGATTNTAILEATGGGTLQLDTVVNNSGGTIEALAGSTVILTNGFNGSVNGGTLTTSGTGIIESQNGVLDGTVNIPNNAGKLSVNNFDLFIQGTINNTGTITLVANSCVILNKPSTLEGKGKLMMASTTCIFGAGIPFTNQSNITGSGSIGDSNPMPITNDITGVIFANQSKTLLIVPDASGFTNNGTLMVNKGSTLTVQGLFNSLSGGSLTGKSYVVSGTLNFPGPVTANASSITLTGPTAEIFNTAGGNNALAMLAANGSTGSLTLQAGQALTTTTSLSNTGKVTVAASSSLTLGGSYTQTAGTTSVDGALTAPTGLSLQKGTLQGKGTVASAITSNATVIVGDATTKAGKLTVSGSYTQNSAGILDVAIGGTQVGTQYSQMAVSNGAALAGTLNIKRPGGFVPGLGATFTILTASAVSGQFAQVKGTSINSSEHFEVSYNLGSVTLTVVSGP
jgi:hypothetical protein